MQKLNSFENKVLGTIRRYDMLDEGDKVLVGLSGGKDSVVLLTTLIALARVLKIEVCAFHLNHSIRGDEAQGDLEFSKALCEKLMVPFESDKVDVPSIAAQSRMGLEAAARSARYDAFERFADKMGCNKIATAHTLSDNTETLLISLIRTGTLSPIPPVRGKFIRPLIDVTGDEVIDYAVSHSMDFVTDSTNLSNDYLRNFLRNDLLPQIKQRSDGFDKSMQRSGKIYSSMRGVCEELAQEYLSDNPNPLSVNELSRLARDKSRLSVLFYVLEDVFRNQGLKLTFERFDAIFEALVNPVTGKTFSIAQGVNFVIGAEKVYFDEDNVERFDYSIPLRPGVTRIPDSPFKLVMTKKEEISPVDAVNKQKINKITKNIVINYNIIDNNFYIRPKASGDEYRCGGITRNIKKYLIDIKLDRKLRRSFPILCDTNGIAWVPGLGIADRLKDKNDGEEYILFLAVDE